MEIDFYQILGVTSTASLTEIKSAYRILVKKYHPDSIGENKKILEINAAWEVLGDPDSRKSYDNSRKDFTLSIEERVKRSDRNAKATNVAKEKKGKASCEDNDLFKWMNTIYIPIDNLLGQVINPFPKQLRDLSADPYDDSLMDTFCSYLEKSQKKMNKVHEIYGSLATPQSAKNFGLNLYHCLSEVQDALNELKLYAAGYVDNYLHDGNEMLRQAKKKRLRLKKEKNLLPTNKKY